jgi:hypothetical protein
MMDNSKFVDNSMRVSGKSKKRDPYVFLSSFMQQLQTLNIGVRGKR